MTPAFAPTPSPTFVPAPATWILTGPTATGKTALALALAERLPLEIISVDSALVYRGMDIGTAKPTAPERAAVPHHLIDLLDPVERYSAARFVADAGRLMDEIRARGRIPLLVGGTMLYVKALVDGLDDIPSSDPVIGARLDQRASQQGWPALHAELAVVDPTTAARLAPNDAQRIQRALEVWHATGMPISHYQKQRPTADDRGAGTVLVSLEPVDRAWLHDRINQRFTQMMANGLIDEVEALRARGDLHPGLPSIRCVGYRQVWEALDNGQNLADPTVRQGVAELGAAATRQLAKRQITWLRSMPWRHVLACDQRAFDEMLDQATAWFMASATLEPHP